MHPDAVHETMIPTRDLQLFKGSSLANALMAIGMVLGHLVGGRELSGWLRPRDIYADTSQTERIPFGNVESLGANGSSLFLR